MPSVTGDAPTIVLIPYSTQANDKVAYDLRMLTPDEFCTRQFDLLYEESRHTALVYARAVHPYLSGVPQGISALERIPAHITSPDGVWLARGSEIIDAYVDVVEG